MNTRALRILAVVLALAAVLMGYWGYRLTQQQKGATQDADAAREAAAGAAHAVLTLHSIAAGHAITASDVKLVDIPVQREGSFAAVADVIGKVPTRAVPAGEILSARYFAPASPLARAVYSGERAVAIHVDEIIAGGGFVQAGDYVDVLLYLRGGSAELRATSAQVVLRHVRVLAFGDTVGEKISPITGTAAKQNASAVKSRAAVLAVSSTDASRLMLAASAGDLRLAVYGAQEGEAFSGAQGSKGARDLITLQEMAPTGSSTSPRAVSRAASGVTIYHGSTKDVVN